MDHSKIMERCSYIRKDKQLSFRKFADLLGVSHGAVQNIEHKKVEAVSNLYIRLLCEKLQVNKDWLLYGRGEIYNSNALPSVKLIMAIERLKNRDSPELENLLLIAHDLDKEHLEKLSNLALDYLDLMKCKKKNR